MNAESDHVLTWPDEKRLTMVRIFFDIFRGRSAAEISALTAKAGLKRSDSTVRRDREECLRIEGGHPPSMESCRAYMAVLGRPDGFDISAPGTFSELLGRAEEVSREHQAQFGFETYVTEPIDELPDYWQTLTARIEQEEWLSVIDIIELDLKAKAPDPASERVRHYIYYFLGMAHNYRGSATESLRRFEQALEAAKAHPDAVDLTVDAHFMCGLKAADCGQVDKAERYLLAGMKVMDSKPLTVVNALVLGSKLRDKVFGMVVGKIAEMIRTTNRSLDWPDIRKRVLEDPELTHRTGDGIFLDVIDALDERIRRGES